MQTPEITYQYWRHRSGGVWAVALKDGEVIAVSGNELSAAEQRRDPSDQNFSIEDTEWFQEQEDEFELAVQMPE